MVERKPFLLRIDPDLYAELRRWADQELRSVNAQIEYVLRRAVAKRRGEEPSAEDSPPAPPGTDPESPP